MDVLGACIGLGVLAFAAGGALLGWLAYMRIGKLERRIDGLERDRESAPVRSERARAPESPATASAMPAVETARPDKEPLAGAPLAGAPLTTAPLAGAPLTSAPLTTAPPSTRPAPPAVPAEVPAPSPRVDREPAASPPAIPPVLAHAAAAEPATPPATPRVVPPADSARPATPPRPAAKPFDLERWVGVRGAAVIGGVCLAIAGFLFLQHSIERGWITPLARVIAATIGGIACLVASFPLRRRGYAITASALAGAGAVILYAASWAASMLYGFISPFAAFAAMGLVTAACVHVAWKHGSQLVAVLGLVGGFATPLVLSTGQDRPFGLFGYVLLLDLAFLFLAGRRRWPWIGIVALLGTTLIQGLWVATHMDPGESWIGLGMLGLFALTFAGFATTRQPSERTSWIPAQAGAVLLPFAFVLYFAQSLALAIPLGALALLAALLCAGAGVLARRGATPWLPVGSAAGSTALLFTWGAAQPLAFDASAAWLLAGCALVLAAIQHAFAEWRRADRTIVPGAIAGAATSAIGALVLAGYAAIDPGSAHAWPWIACFGVLALLLQRQAALADRIELAWIGASGAGLGLAIQRFATLGALRSERDVPILIAVAAIGALLLVAAHRRRSAARIDAFTAAAGYFAPAMGAVWSSDLFLNSFAPEHALAIGAALVLAIGALAAAGGARSGACFLVAALATFFTQAAHVVGPDVIAASAHWATFVGLLAATTMLFAVWPLATRTHWRHSSLAWCVAAFQPLAWALPIGALVEARYADSLDFVTPLVFALGTALLARASWSAASETEEVPLRVQRHARIATTMTALLFASSVVPIHVDVEPAAITLAIFGAALAAFWTRMDSLVVKWVGVLALAGALFRLALTSEPWSFALPPRPIANVHVWTLLVPAACAVFASMRFRAHELERARGFETGLLGSKQPIAAGIAGFAAVALVFVWINVEIAGLFAIGERVGLHEPHERGRALATSLGWAVYALVLLTLGVTRRASGPRWASLLLFVATIAKVFLFDLGHLTGLQRAGSMLGLALSLILVSLVYQRFVFRRAPVPEEPAAPVS